MLLQIRNNTLVPSARERQNINCRDYVCIHTHTVKRKYVYVYASSHSFSLMGTRNLSLFLCAQPSSIFSALILLWLRIFVKYVVFINATMYDCWITFGNRCARARRTTKRIKLPWQRITRTRKTEYEHVLTLLRITLLENVITKKKWKKKLQQKKEDKIIASLGLFSSFILFAWFQVKNAIERFLDYTHSINPYDISKNGLQPLIPSNAIQSIEAYNN